MLIKEADLTDSEARSELITWLQENLPGDLVDTVVDGATYSGDSYTDAITINTKLMESNTTIMFFPSEYQTQYGVNLFGYHSSIPKPPSPLERLNSNTLICYICSTGTIFFGWKLDDNYQGESRYKGLAVCWCGVGKTTDDDWAMFELRNSANDCSMPGFVTSGAHTWPMSPYGYRESHPLSSSEGGDVGCHNGAIGSLMTCRVSLGTPQQVFSRRLPVYCGYTCIYSIPIGYPNNPTVFKDLYIASNTEYFGTGYVTLNDTQYYVLSGLVYVKA